MRQANPHPAAHVPRRQSLRILVRAMGTACPTKSSEQRSTNAERRATSHELTATNTERRTQNSELGTRNVERGSEAELHHGARRPCAMFAARSSQLVVR